MKNFNENGKLLDKENYLITRILILQEEYI